MKVLFVASEAAPLIKVGGLGDVIGSLPKALSELGVEATVALPLYESIGQKVEGQKIAIAEICQYEIGFGRDNEKITVWQTYLDSAKTIPVYLFENKKYLSTGEHAAFEGNEGELNRFLFFSKAAAELLTLPSPLSARGFEIIHCHDWHTGLIPLLLKHRYLSASLVGRRRPRRPKIEALVKPDRLRCLLTIHNISYQGIGPVETLQKIGLSANDCRVLKWDVQNLDINWLMEGIIHANSVSTVSPSYAKELLTSEFGWQLEGVLRARNARLWGILNGLDEEVWDPERDQDLWANYGRESFLQGKKTNKKLLVKKLFPEQPPERLTEKPLFAFIGRLDPEQKGLDILYEALKARFLGNSSKQGSEGNFLFVLLGHGDPEWEKKFLQFEKKVKSTVGVAVSVKIGFDEVLAHRLYAAADFVLLPSRFEPCGLVQMIAMRYGTLPVAHGVGGLKDTIRHLKTGILFPEYSIEALEKALTETLKIWQDKKRYAQMVARAMREDFSWKKSAKEYLKLYQLLMSDSP